MAMLKAFLCSLLVLSLVENGVHSYCYSDIFGGLGNLGGFNNIFSGPIAASGGSGKPGQSLDYYDFLGGLGSFNIIPTVRTCKEAAQHVGRNSKAKVNYIINGKKVKAVCDTSRKYDQYDWLVIQRRVKGDVNFVQTFATYTRGFGKRESDLWLGLENIHQLTGRGGYILKIEMMISGQYYFATYRTFSLQGAARRYVVKMGGYSGTAGNSYSYHCGHAFYTYDRDNRYRCSNQNGRGGWWYYCCYQSNLNGVYRGIGKQGVNWYAKTRYNGGATVQWVQMKIRKI